MNRKIGIIWKYFIAYSIIATVVIFVLALMINETTQSRCRRWVTDDLRNYALFAGETFKRMLDGDSTEINKLARELGKRTGTRITLIAPDGTILADTEKDLTWTENLSERPEVKRALSGEIGTSTRYSTVLKERMSYVAVPVVEKGKIKGAVRVSRRSKEVDSLIGGITRRILLLSVIMCVIVLIITSLFSSLLSSSIREMVSLTRRIAGGDFTARANVRSRDELGALAAALNEMARRLQSSFEQLQTWYDELKTIINSMSEGVLVLDRNLRVRLINGSFKRMFSMDEEIIGKSYIEAIRCAAFKEIMDKLLKSGRVRGERIEFMGKVFRVNGSAFKRGREEEFVLVFHDITADSQIERIKADFVANASHELRTPLTAIRGYLETFDEEDRETQRKFIQVIRRNVERMSNLVSDLLLLSRLESSYPRLNLERVNLSDLAEDVIKLVEKTAKEKGIKVRVEIDPKASVIGDSFLLEQMLLNLLDNAVKYTDHGEVILQAKVEDEGVTIQVSDTGIGIPPEHLPRIFERFYRVDRVRSRKLGGTGLGLSIVKHIIQLHGGEIHVTSQLGKGSSFTVRLPSSSNSPSQGEPYA